MAKIVNLANFRKLKLTVKQCYQMRHFCGIFKQCVEGVNHTLVFQRILTPLPIPFTSFDYFFCNHFPAKNGLGNMKWPAAQLVY